MRGSETQTKNGIFISFGAFYTTNEYQVNITRILQVESLDKRECAWFNIQRSEV